MKRLIVFMDWQNLYKRARGCFYCNDDPDFTHGQVWPHKLAQYLAERASENASEGSEPFEAVDIRVYRGAPKNDEDPKAYNAFQRQIAAWKRHNNRITIIKRDIVYPKSRNSEGQWARNSDPPKEKGIDVSLAVDVVTLAVEGRFDHAVVFSSDQDIAPAIEFVAKRADASPGHPGISVAAWDGGSRLRAQNIRVMCHWIKESDFRRLADSTNYTERATASSSGGAPKPGLL